MTEKNKENKNFREKTEKIKNRISYIYKARGNFNYQNEKRKRIINIKNVTFNENNKNTKI